MGRSQFELLHDVDPVEFNRLVKQHAKMIHGLAYMMIRDYFEAEDITQQVFIKVYVNLAKLRDSKKMGSWIYAITRRVCMDWLRKKRIETMPLEDVETLLLSEGVEAKILQNETNNEVKLLLNTFPEQTKLMATYHFMEGYTAKEISDLYKVPIKTVESRLRRVKFRFKKEMVSMLDQKFQDNTLSDNFEEKLEEKIEKEIHCSFCKKEKSKVGKMFAAPEGIYICDECVFTLAFSILPDVLGGSVEFIFPSGEIKAVSPLGKEFHGVRYCPHCNTYNANLEKGNDTNCIRCGETFPQNYE